MKKYFLIPILLVAFFMSSCESTEVELHPSNVDTDRILSQIDLSNPVVQKLYTNFNTGILINYDSTKDFAYAASSDIEASIWGKVEIPMMKKNYVDASNSVPAENKAAYDAYVVQGINFIDNTLFKYFKPNTKIAKLMPNKVLLSNNIQASNTITGINGNVLIESESRYNSSSANGQRAVFNAHSIVFQVNKDEISNVSNLTKFTKDNFYILFSRIIGMHNLVNEIPDSFFTGKNAYYGKNMDVVYRSEFSIPTTKSVWVIDKQWFYSKGFVDATYFFTPGGLSTFVQTRDENNVAISPFITHTKALRPTYNFVADKYKDVRSYLNEMLYRDATQLAAFPANIRANMILLRDLFTSWGVDIVAINPALATLK